MLRLQTPKITLPKRKERFTTKSFWSLGLCLSPKLVEFSGKCAGIKKSSHLTPNQIQSPSDLHGLRGFPAGMKAGKAKPHHPEILTWGRRCARRWRGEAAPLPLEAHATFLLPTPTSTSQEKGCCFRRPGSLCHRIPRVVEGLSGGQRQRKGSKRFRPETNTLDRAWGGK